MRLAISRGIIYHKLSFDILSLIKAFTFNLQDEKITKEFEDSFASYMGSRHCVSFPFARTAIFYALKSQNFPPGTEIIMPPITIKAILDVVLELRLKPVFVDIELDSLCFDFFELKRAIGKNTKAILITYLFGMVPNIEQMVSYCKKKGLFVIEDFSQCLNGKFKDKKMGTFGDVGVYSASSIKTLDTYGGGLLVCQSDNLYSIFHKNQNELSTPSRKNLIKKIVTNLVRNLATTRIVFHFFTFPFIKIISFLKPGIAIKHTGDRNKEMLSHLPKRWFESYSCLQAKVGLKLLPTVETFDWQRVSNVEKIKSRSPKIKFPLGVSDAKNVYWQLVAYFDNAEKIQHYFHSKKLDTSTTSLAKISNLPNYPYQGKTPNADMLYSKGCFIPSYPYLSEEDINYIIGVLNEIPE